MDIFSLDFLGKLLTIVFIDLLLAGDNAIVIGLSARNLPKETQKKAIWLGTGGAIVIRVVATLLVVYLLEIPFLQAIGGVVLMWIAYKLLVQEEHHEEVKAGSSLWAAVRTIVIADAAMGLDNVIAVAGAAQGETLLVIIGLLISIPVVVWGSTLFVGLLNRFPWIVYIGSAVLAYTAAKMVTHEPKLDNLFHGNPVLTYTFIAVMVVAIVVGGLWTNSIKAQKALAKANASGQDKQASGAKRRESH
ncbi:YjbE family putative metal transport protein [Cohnella thailandensis]|uniref:TerC family protein n=1 Tax=Cohnella thailandensis TaxID=557557 RepID=A0A841T059_9BACL|nr:TerC family protein [Cohnella thailandensis]MBP1973775.1 YjbE family integral membrane protein [Cohnella thailandensis]